MIVGKGTLGVIFALSVWPGIPTALYVDKFKTAEDLQEIHDRSLQMHEPSAYNLELGDSVDWAPYTNGDIQQIDNILAFLANCNGRPFRDQNGIMNFLPDRECINGWGRDFNVQLVDHFNYDDVPGRRLLENEPADWIDTSLSLVGQKTYTEQPIEHFSENDVVAKLVIHEDQVTLVAKRIQDDPDTWLDESTYPTYGYVKQVLELAEEGLRVVQGDGHADPDNAQIAYSLSQGIVYEDINPPFPHAPDRAFNRPEM